MTIADLIARVILTLRDPRSGARSVLALDWPRRARWEALALIVVLSVALILLVQLFGTTAGTMTIMGQEVGTAIGLGMAQMVVVVGGAYAMAGVGRFVGGQGDLDGAILLMAWLQFTLFALQCLQIALLLVIPVLADLIGIVAFFLTFWLLVHFVSELHGFRSLGLVFLGILLTMLGFAIAFSIVLGVLGVELTVGA